MARAFVPHTITSDSALGGSVIERSLRFNDDDGAFLQRTPSSAGNRKKWTFSAWIKKTKIGSQSRIFGGDANASHIFFSNSDELRWDLANEGSSSAVGALRTNAIFRDTTSWYHIVCAYDTDNSTANDRMRMYLNGTELTDFATRNNPSSGYATNAINAASVHTIGRRTSAQGTDGMRFDGYMTEINFIDGQALDASYFGYTEFQTKVWRPKSFIAKGPNNGTTWSGNVTASNFSSGSSTHVFDGNFSGTSATINSSDASNNHITLSSVNVVASKVGVVLSNSSSDVQVYVNGSLVGTAAGGDIINNNPKHFEFTFTQTTVSTIKVQRVSSTSGWQIYGVSLNGITLIDGDVSNVGRNGFKLDFRDFTGNSGNNIGYDYSGNGNNFSPNNFSGTTDGAIDSPTNNFTSFSKIMDYSLNADITEAGLRVEGPDSGHNDRRIYAPFAIPLTGKYYVEVKCVKNGARGTIGFSDGAINGVGNGSNWFSFGFHMGGYSTSFTKVGSNTSDFSVNDIVSFALDMDAGKMWLVKNGNVDVTAQESITAIVRTNLDRPLRWFYQETSSDESAALFNFGQFPYNYTVPDGFKTLSSRNIQPTYFRATNQPVKTFLNPKNHFNTLLYTGTGSANHHITGSEFKPDLVWIKARTQAYTHLLYDSLRGVGKQMYSNSSAVEYTNLNNLYSFNSNGFSLGQSGNDDVTNKSGDNFVAWCWKAGGAAVSNTDGTITSQVSANPTAGFSIVTYTGNHTSGATVGHGLGVAPKVVIVKARGTINNQSRGWNVYHASLGNTKYIQLNSSNASVTNSDWWNNTSPNSTTFTLGNDYDVNADISGGNYVAYCWSEIPGYSKFDSYIGNGSTNGVYVHLGFRPAWLMVKNISSSYNWMIFDVKRSPFNDINDYLFADLSEAEGTGSSAINVDFLSNGFKWRGSSSGNNYINKSGDTFIYMAFAEQPGITTYGSSPTAR